MKPFRAELFAVAALLMLASVAVSAQEPAREESETPEPEIVQEIVHVEHADVQVLRRVLRVFPLDVQGYPEMGLITLRGNPEDVATAVAAARRLDLPPEPTAAIEVIAHVLGASRERELPGGVPAPLEEVAGQLREVFGYRGVRLLDSLVLRVRDRGDGQVTGVMSDGRDGAGLPYTLGFNGIALVNGGEPRAIRIEGFVFEARIGPPDPPAATEGVNSPRVRSDIVRLVTDLDVREGQKVVVGKAASGGGGREALIVVIEARLTE